MNIESLLDEIDKRVRTKYNTQKFSSVFLNNSILYFDEHGLPMALYTPYMVGGPMGSGVSVDEFDYRDKLPGV